MTRKEFEQRVKDENLKMRAFYIELDHYYDGYPHYMGCVKNEGKWVIYETDERSGRAYIYNEFDNELEDEQWMDNFLKQKDVLAKDILELSKNVSSTLNCNCAVFEYTDESVKKKL